jgi:hypothetical protein
MRALRRLVGGVIVATILGGGALSAATDPTEPTSVPYPDYCKTCGTSKWCILIGCF